MDILTDKDSLNGDVFGVVGIVKRKLDVRSARREEDPRTSIPVIRKGGKVCIPRLIACIERHCATFYDSNDHIE